MNQPAEGHTRLIDGICDELEREYRGGRRPRIEDYLPRVAPEQREHLLRELLAVELDYRLQRGERPAAAEYRQRFPGCDAAIAAALGQPGTRTVGPASAPPPSPAGHLLAPAVTVTLAVMAGPQQGHVFTFAGRGAFLVGRGAAAHLRLADPHLSRSHFLLELDPPACRLTELDSRNRTQINDHPVALDRSHDLSDGDLVRAGATLFRVSLGAPARMLDASDAQDTVVLGGEAWPQTVPPTAPAPGLGVTTDAAPAWKPEAQASEGTSAAQSSQGGSYETCAPTAPSPPPLDICPVLIGYRLERELGRGGMGVVYLGTRLADGSRVAVKTIIPAVKVGPSQVQRFVREANILRQLEHPNIVRFHEAGESDGILYLAMAYVEGTDAARMLREQGPLPIKTAVRMTCQLLSALEYAHDKGFVHRDIKPANMLVEEAGGKRTVKLADFGLARVYQESRMSGLTIEGDVGGTVAFMAPEQITGFRQTKPAADQYAAAAALYNLLTGQLLFDFDRSKGSSLDKVLKEEPIPLLSRRADVPPELAAVIHRALLKDPELRFPDVRTFRAALKVHA
jgi:serine/threonine-protein kinase